MAEYIDREALINHLNQSAAKHYSRAVERVIELEPAADVAPVRRGHWERHKNIIQCSRCGFGMFPIDYAFDRGDCVGINVIPGHCPKCGAELKEVGK